ncbi:MAG: hypothetical protein IIB15_05930 [Chloroflexi bacterium]|nr:hypothetical protein [Chloroflexota bacterium]MCH8109650.1 hypothetical protein [Chloroflexota bacterium]
MTELSKEDIHALARMAGIRLDDQRADVIVARLSAVIEELDTIPDDALADVEPALTFVVEERQHE